MSVFGLSQSAVGFYIIFLICIYWIHFKFSSKNSPVGVTLSIPLGADVLILIISALMSHLEIHNHVLETLDLSPDLWLEDVVAVLGCHHQVAIQTKLCASCSIEITKKNILA